MKKLKKFFVKYNEKLTYYCFILFFALMLILSVLNQYNVQFLYNGFNKMNSFGLQVYFLDVGQASSTFVVFPNGRNLLVDTGSSESVDDFLIGLDKIMRQNKIKEIDTLLLTHSDEDHVGGAVSLLEKYQVNRVYRPKIVSNSPIDVLPQDMKAIDSWIYASVMTAVYSEPNCEVNFVEDEMFFESDCKVEIFACKENSYGKNDTNSFSPFITITYNLKVFMLCGDASTKREQEFIESMKAEERDVTVDFLLVAHHGSKTSSSEEFLSFIKPSYAFISAGDDLHPTQDALDRLISCGVRQIYCTKDDGMIAVGVGQNDSFKIFTMSKFLDLPTLVCLVFVVSFVWYNYFRQSRNIRKFSY